MSADGEGGCVLSGHDSSNQFHSSRLAVPPPRRRGNPPATPTNCWDLPTLNGRVHRDRAGWERGDPRPVTAAAALRAWPASGAARPAPDRAQPQKSAPRRPEAGRGRRGRRLPAPVALAEPGGLRRRAERGAGIGRGGRGPQGETGRAAGKGRAGGGGYKPHKVKRRALPTDRTHLPRIPRRSWLLSTRLLLVKATW